MSGDLWDTDSGGFVHTDLVSRLRRLNGAEWNVDGEFTEAADRIAKLELDLAAMTEKRDNAAMNTARYGIEAVDRRAELAAEKALADRLGAALTWANDIVRNEMGAVAEVDDTLAAWTAARTPDDEESGFGRD